MSMATVIAADKIVPTTVWDSVCPFAFTRAHMVSGISAIKGVAISPYR